MTSFVKTKAGLIVPAHAVAQGGAGNAGAVNTKAPTPSAEKPSVDGVGGNFSPSIPAGFQRDLDAYNARMGKTLRAHFNNRYKVWNIQALASDGQWINILAVLDEDKVTELDPYPYRPLDRRVFEDLYAADLAYRFATGNPDLDIEMYHVAVEEAQRIAKDRLQQQTDTLFADIELDARRINNRIAEFLRGDAADLKVMHQVPANTPVGGGS